MIDAAFVNHYFETHRQAILDDWFALLRIPTVGADPKRLGDCARAAAWLKQFLKPLGFEAEILTPGRGLPVPVLIAERPGREDAPTVLFYGHYDVQPEDPLNEWQTPPFEPTLIDGRVYARGAQDNKGQVFGFLQGVKALIEAGESLPTIKLVLEGQEESGSSALNDLAPILKQRLKADVMMVSDTACGPDNQPAIVAGLRGVQHFTVTLTGPPTICTRGARWRGTQSGTGHGGVARLVAYGGGSDCRGGIPRPCAPSLGGGDGDRAARHADGRAVREHSRLSACRWRTGAGCGGARLFRADD